VAGLAWFWLRGRVPAALKPRLLLLLALGGLQGAIGWFMVASGFDADRTAVSPYRLVIHLGLAFVLFGLLFWTALSLLRPARSGPINAGALRGLVHATAALAVLAMLAGGFVAGIRAGFSYNTFPLMDGRLLPEGYWDLTPALANFSLPSAVSPMANPSARAQLVACLAPRQGYSQVIAMHYAASY
jgi:cytochrome c oxidase assembly protein subunit 15